MGSACPPNLHCEECNCFKRRILSLQNVVIYNFISTITYIFGLPLAVFFLSFGPLWSLKVLHTPGGPTPSWHLYTSQWPIEMDSDLLGRYWDICHCPQGHSALLKKLWILNKVFLHLFCGINASMINNFGFVILKNNIVKFLTVWELGGGMGEC